MTLKKRLIKCHVFAPNRPLAGVQRENAVYQQKRVPMRQDLFDCFDVQFRQNDLLKFVFCEQPREAHVQSVTGLHGDDLGTEGAARQCQIAD